MCTSGRVGAFRHRHHAIVGSIPSAADLRAKITGDIGDWDLDAVDEPTDLVPTAHVKHIVGHVSTRDVIGDHGYAVPAGRTRRQCDVLAANKSGRVTMLTFATGEMLYLVCRIE